MWGISDQKVWAAKKRPEASKKQEEDLWSHGGPSLPANERLSVHCRVGCAVSEEGRGRGKLGAHCTP